jgi:hypothetical protein
MLRPAGTTAGRQAKSRAALAAAAVTCVFRAGAQRQQDDRNDSERGSARASKYPARAMDASWRLQRDYISLRDAGRIGIMSFARSLLNMVSSQFSCAS